ncbi:hypothetical protein PC116_g13365 [Phytophthora cactorum]|nr:hypothetical protein PC119_g14829 [Phytophthora cactorum]KAG4238616.1 hypothetical protein PC116_g13365 [Phytophthora cactorum]
MVRQYALGTTRAAARSMSITLAIVVAMLVNADGLISNKAPSTSSDNFTTDTLCTKLLLYMVSSNATCSSNNKNNNKPLKFIST